MRHDKPRNIFTKSQLLNKGFVEVIDGGEQYLMYTRSELPTERNFLITNDKSKPEEDEWRIDYGYQSKFAKRENNLTDLDEGLVNDFIKNLDVLFGMETWFEKLISR